MHLFGTFLLFAAMSGFGLICAGDLKRRPRELRSLIDALELLHHDIGACSLPTPDALAHVGGMSTGGTRAFFLSVSDKLCHSNGSFSQLWEEESNKLNLLKKEDRIAVIRLGNHLAQYDASSQCDAIQACITYLCQSEQQARRYSQDYSRLYTGLGMTLGAMLAVILY